MASEAEVDLIISTADALPQLEQDLSRIINTAEDGAESIDVQASMNVQQQVAVIATDLNRIIARAEAGDPTVDLDAALDAQAALSALTSDLSELNRAVGASGVDEIDLHATLDFPASLAAVNEAVRDLVTAAEAAAPEIDVEVDVDSDALGRVERQGLNLGRVLRPLGSILGTTARGLGGVGLAAGSAAPLLAGVVTSLEAIAPAAALATTGILAVQVATQTVKLAMVGVKEAIDVAFDPEAKPEDLAKALEKLAPNARSFVEELRGMRGAFRELQQDVQDEFFSGFDDALISLSTNVIPQFSTAVRSTSTILNQMALGAAAAAIELGANGTLQTALLGATEGLANLREIPGEAVTAFGQLAAAAAPSFERVTAAAAQSFEAITDRLGAAFESGALEDAISGAVDTIAQLGRIAGNVFGGIGNIINGVSVEGNGLFTTLEKITAAFQEVTASDGFQQALRALTQTVGVLVETALPVVTTALEALGPVFESLAGPVQILIQALGPALTKIITALAPVLVSAGQAFGQLVIAVTPLIELAAELIAAILPGLTPLFDALGQTLNSLVPFIETLATTLASALVPIFTRIATEVLPQVLPPLVELSTRLIPILTDVIIQLAPTLVQLAGTFGELLVAVAPLIAELALLTVEMLDKLMPVIQPLIDIVLKLINIALKVLASEITGLIIPTIKILVSLLQGDFSGAWNQAGDLVSNIGRKITEVIDRMVGDVGDQIRTWIIDLVNKARKLHADFVRVIEDLRDEVIDNFKKMPGQILSVLGDLGSLLVGAGRDLVQGLIDGISGKLARLREIAGEIASTVSGTVKDVLGISSPSKVMREVGHDTMDGAILGIKDRLPDLSAQLQGVGAMAASFALPNGQTLQLPDFQQRAPMVNVYIGNEQIDARIDTRVAVANVHRDRVAMQGVRR